MFQLPRRARNGNNARLLKPANVMCLECHGPDRPTARITPPPIEAHTHHAAGSAGNECVACHMPKIEQTIADVNVRSHTFRFITPAMTDAYKIPNPCTSCHNDKTTAWAAAQLRNWKNISPWRAE